MRDEKHEKDSLTVFMDNLDNITFRLRRTAKHILSSLSVSLLLLGFSQTLAPIYRTLLLNFASLLTACIGLILLTQFSQLKKDGMAYYEEIADELEWGKNRQEHQLRPSMQFRIALKKFLQATDLIFTSSANGQFLYFGFLWITIIVNFFFMGRSF